MGKAAVRPSGTDRRIRLLFFLFGSFLLLQLYLTSRLSNEFDGSIIHDGGGGPVGRPTEAKLPLELGSAPGGAGNSNVTGAVGESSAMEGGYDIVTLVHHDDMGVFLDLGLASWQKYFVHSDDTNIFVICTRQAYERLLLEVREAAKSSDNSTLRRVWKNVVLVQESIFPFTLETVGKHAWHDKFTWIYQQVLKLYSYRVLSPSSTANRDKSEPRLKPLFLVQDSDTVAVRPYEFVVHGKPVYNIASMASGAFESDCVIAGPELKEVFNGSISRAYPNVNGQKFTAIAHHMMFDGSILEDMLAKIEAAHNGLDAWIVVSKLKESALSEWELYMAYLMKYHRDAFFVRQAAYMNWGMPLTELILQWLQQRQDVYYVSKHDEWQRNAICCVNSNWRKPGGETNGIHWQSKFFSCRGCTIEHCNRTIIDCQVLGIEACRQDKNGLMWFGGDEPAIMPN